MFGSKSREISELTDQVNVLSKSFERLTEVVGQMNKNDETAINTISELQKVVIRLTERVAHLELELAEHKSMVPYNPYVDVYIDGVVQKGAHGLPDDLKLVFHNSIGMSRVYKYTTNKPEDVKD